jgi:hypothetical protein
MKMRRPKLLIATFISALAVGGCNGPTSSEVESCIKHHVAQTTGNYEVLPPPTSPLQLQPYNIEPCRDYIEVQSVGIRDKREQGGRAIVVTDVQVLVKKPARLRGGVACLYSQTGPTSEIARAGQSVSASAHVTLEKWSSGWRCVRVGSF